MHCTSVRSPASILKPNEHAADRTTPHPFSGSSTARRALFSWRGQLAGAGVSRRGRGAAVSGERGGRISAGCGRQPLHRLFRVVGADDSGARISAGGGGDRAGGAQVFELRGVDGGGGGAGRAGSGVLSEDREAAV